MRSVCDGGRWAPLLVGPMHALAKDPAKPWVLVLGHCVSLHQSAAPNGNQEFNLMTFKGLSLRSSFNSGAIKG